MIKFDPDSILAKFKRVWNKTRKCPCNGLKANGVVNIEMAFKKNVELRIVGALCAVKRY